MTAYRCGELVDLCTGPHVPNTGHVRALALAAVSSVQGTPLSGSSNEKVEEASRGISLQRVSGVGFGSKESYKDWKVFQAEAKKRDHRVIGTAQDLFMFHDASPGSPFFLPHGTHIYNTLLNWLR